MDEEKTEPVDEAGSTDGVRALSLRSVGFVAGAQPGAPGLEIAPGHMTVLVGPNNSGKSLALRELEDMTCRPGAEGVVIDRAELVMPSSEDEAASLLERFRISTPPNQQATPGQQWYGGFSFRKTEPMRRFQLAPESVRAWFRTEHKNYQSHVAPFYVARLDGRTRFELSDEKPPSDLLAHPENHLAALFQDGAAREIVREATQAAFNLSFVIDPTGMARFRIRMSDEPPASEDEEQGLGPTSRRFHQAATPIADTGDGVKAFTGLVSAVASLPHRMLLVDEPEAFLHPPLARRLGGILARTSEARQASVVAATHSSDFLLGVLAEAPETTIVRLTHEAGVATARALSAEDLRKLMLDPLIRSTDALQGVFHRSVVIGESETDRALYDEVNRRLLAEDRGLRDSLFLSAQNWQTCVQVATPLRKLGIPAAVVLDFDTLLESGGAWTKFYEMCGLTDEATAELRDRKGSVQSKLRGLDRRVVKSEGIEALNPTDRATCEALLQEFRSLGIFIVPGGELESWLSALECSGRKVHWLVKVFEALGSDPGSEGYVTPGEDDVWAFLDTIAAWASDPDRRGLPES